MEHPIEDSWARGESSFVQVLKECYKMAHFRILVIGRANAGKTTILEKVCNVKQGTKPVVRGTDGVEVKFDGTKNVPRWRRLIGRGKESSAQSLGRDFVPLTFKGKHLIEHQIEYPGCNFIFHDSCGFESGGRDEVKIVKRFLKDRSRKKELKDQLHAIWYCIPLDTPRPILPAEREFLDQGTGNVPLIFIFTKFDALVVREFANLGDVEDDEVGWKRARANAERTLQVDFLQPIMNAKYPPRAFATLEHMTEPNASCTQLVVKTASVIEIVSLNQLFTANLRIE